MSLILSIVFMLLVPACKKINGTDFEVAMIKVPKFKSIL